MKLRADSTQRYRLAALAVLLTTLALIVPRVLLSLSAARASNEQSSGTQEPVAYLPLIARPNTPTTTPSTPTPTQVVLPDLIITNMSITLETGGACNYPSTNLGMRVWFQNIGDASAGAFVVELNGVRQNVVGGLGAGASDDMWFPSYAYPGLNTAIIDATFLVSESREDNNQLSQNVPIPTLPPTCTPTLTPSTTVTPTSFAGSP